MKTKKWRKRLNPTAMRFSLVFSGRLDTFAPSKVIRNP